MRRIFIYFILSLMPLLAMAQQESSDVRKGNRQYNKEKYTEAEVSYRKGLDKNNNSMEGHFNLGDALFRQEKYEDAIKEFQSAGALIKPGKDGKYSDADKKKLAQVHHNIGNSYYMQQQFDKAVAAYKQSLMANPKDDETRYNLVQALRMMQQQQQQQQSQDQKQDQQNKDQQQQQQQEQQQQQPPQDQNQDQQEPNMDKEQAEQLLQALQQDEQETQDKAKRQQMQSKFRTDKDW